MTKEQKARAHLARAQELLGQGTLAFGGMKSKWKTANRATKIHLIDPSIDGITPEPRVFEDHKGLRLSLMICELLDENAIAEITEEVQILQGLSKTSRNLLQIDQFTFLKDDIHSHLVLAYANADLPLYDYCHNDTYRFSSYSTTKMHISHEIANGLAELHAKSWIHGDLALRNVSVTDPDSEFPRIKLFNVSLPVCNKFIQKHEGNAPTKEDIYLETTPESITEDSYTPKTEQDIYRLGMVMYYISHKLRRWSHVGDVSNIIRLIIRGERPPINLDHTQNTVLEQAIKDCWHQDPSRRPTAKAIVEQLGHYAKDVGGPERRIPSMKTKMTGPYVRPKG